MSFQYAFKWHRFGFKMNTRDITLYACDGGRIKTNYLKIQNESET